MWELLPDLVLEDIFSRLSIRDRYWASMVCQNWNRIFNSSRVWSTFVMEERILTRRRFNYYMGYQHTLDHYRAQICLHKVGRNFRKLVICPITNFFNLYEFINMLSSFAEFFDENPLRFVHTLHFTFACHLIEGDVAHDIVFGTGGKLLQALKRLMGNLKGLRHLTLNELLLEKHEAQYLLDDVTMNCCQTLRTLRLMNCTKDICPIMHVGVMLNLEVLIISPQQLNDEIVVLLRDTALKHLHMVQNANTETSERISPAAWKECRKNKRLRVHLHTEGPIRKEIIWQENAPIRSIVYDSPYAQVTTSSILTVVELYKGDLQLYAHKKLPRFHMERSFEERADSALVLLCRQCPNLRTLVIRELISSATVVLLAWTGKKLEKLYVRKNAIIKKADWPRSINWTSDFYVWLCQTARSYDLMEQEVSNLLGIPWHPLSDKQFKGLRLDYS